MGAYSRTEKSVNGGYPVYTKKGQDRRGRDKTHYLYRAGAGEDTGCWVVTENEEDMTKNEGEIKSKSAAELPTQAGLQWQYKGDYGVWRDDPSMVSTGVSQVAGIMHAYHGL